MSRDGLPESAQDAEQMWMPLVEEPPSFGWNRREVCLRPPLSRAAMTAESGVAVLEHDQVNQDS